METDKDRGGDIKQIIAARENNSPILGSTLNCLVNGITTTKKGNDLCVSSSTFSVELLDREGRSNQLNLSVGGLINFDANDFVEVRLTQHAVRRAYRTYYCLLENKFRLLVKSDMYVDPGLAQVGVGTSLISYDEEFCKRIALLYKKLYVSRIQEFKMIITDSTHLHRNPNWTTRRFQNKPEWTRTDEGKWEKTVLI